MNIYINPHAPLMSGGSGDLKDLQKRLREIREMGWVKSHRTHDTGIGKTFEDLLGIEENNIQLPDIGGIEIKTSRSDTMSMVTLITFEPPSEFRNIPWTIDGLVENLGETGYDKYGNPKFLMTIPYGRYTNNKQKLKLDFRKVVGEDCICVVTKSKINPTNPRLPKDVVVCYPLSEVVKRIQKKLSGCLLVIDADRRKASGGEFFKLQSATLYLGLSFDKFLELLRSGKIFLDIRFGRHRDGRSHNHGTGWRIKERDLPLLYSRKIDFLNDELPDDLNCENEFTQNKKVNHLDKFLSILLLL